LLRVWELVSSGNFLVRIGVLSSRLESEGCFVDSISGVTLLPQVGFRVCFGVSLVDLDYQESI
jgi:hypothetical protein